MKRLVLSEGYVCENQTHGIVKVLRPMNIRCEKAAGLWAVTSPGWTCTAKRWPTPRKDQCHPVKGMKMAILSKHLQFIFTQKTVLKLKDILKIKKIWKKSIKAQG